MTGTIDSQRCFIKDPTIVARKIVDEVILVPIRQKASELESIYTMNDVGARIWELLDGERTVGEIGAVISEEFVVEETVAEKDLVDFLQQLLQIGAIKDT